MHDVADNLINLDISYLILGSDEEAAFKSAISRCFVRLTHVLCTRLLRQNANKNLEDQVGYPLKDRQEVLSKIFDKDRLTHSRDIDTYTSRLSTLRDLIDEKDSKVREKNLGLILMVNCSPCSTSTS